MSRNREFKVVVHNWKLRGNAVRELQCHAVFRTGQAGGSDTVAVAGRGEIWAIRSVEKYEWKNWLRVAYGVSKTNGSRIPVIYRSAETRFTI